MESEKRNDLSKFMSLILRHKPEKFGMTLDPEGYCSLTELHRTIAKERNWVDVTKEDILEVVATCEKQRFELQEDYIRARYGHSKVEIQYEAKTPPAILIHGTHEGAVDSILQTGINKMGRQYIHLSETTHFATLSGQRRGKVAYILVDTKKAMEKGVLFYFAGDEVWLSKDIPFDCVSLKL